MNVCIMVFLATAFAPLAKSFKRGACFVQIMNCKGYSSQTESDINNLSAMEHFQSTYRPFASHFTFSEEQVAQISMLHAKLIEWNQKVNLVSRKDIHQLVPNHIVPALSISLVKQFQSGTTVVDIGSGGGFPGVPLAIACPEAHFTLLDSSFKKMYVVENIIKSIGIQNVQIVTSRAEEYNENKFDFIVGRSVSGLHKFLSVSSHLLKGRLFNSVSGIDNMANSNMDNFHSQKHRIQDGLLYIKGGDFTHELTDAGVAAYSLYPIKSLLSGFNCDKAVLYLSGHEIRAARRRQLSNGCKRHRKLQELVVKSRV